MTLNQRYSINERDHFFGVPANIFLDETTYGFSVYKLQREHNAFLKILGEGTISEQFHETLHTFSTDIVYVHKTEFARYTDYLEQHLEPIIDSDPNLIPQRFYAVYSTLAKDAIKRFFRADRSLNEYHKLVKLSGAFATMISRINSIHDIMDTLTYEYSTELHSLNVGILNGFIGKELDMDTQKLQQVITAGFVFDIGKTQISDLILYKKGKLTRKEWEPIRKHPEYSVQILTSIGVKDNISKIVALQHHEKLDGSGYPLGVPKAKIHPYAQLTAIADMYDSLCSQTSFRKACRAFDALKIISLENKTKVNMHYLKALITALQRKSQDE